jgi:hypothetical protein
VAKEDGDPLSIRPSPVPRSGYRGSQLKQPDSATTRVVENATALRRLGKTSDGGKRSVKRRGALDFNLKLKTCNRSSIT